MVNLLNVNQEIDKQLNALSYLRSEDAAAKKAMEPYTTVTNVVKSHLYKVSLLGHARFTKDGLLIKLRK